MLRNAKDHGESSIRAGPQLLDDVRACPLDDVAQGERDEERVVQLTEHRNEIGDQVEGEREIRDEKPERDLRASRHARVAEQSLAEDGAVGDERRELPRAG